MVVVWSGVEWCVDKQGVDKFQDGAEIEKEIHRDNGGLSFFGYGKQRFLGDGVEVEVRRKERRGHLITQSWESSHLYKVLRMVNKGVRVAIKGSMSFFQHGSFWLGWAALGWLGASMAMTTILIQSRIANLD